MVDLFNVYFSSGDQQTVQVTVPLYSEAIYPLKITILSNASRFDKLVGDWSIELWFVAWHDTECC